MNMPKMQPIPIEVKACSFFKRIHYWLTSVRQWQITEDWMWVLPNGKTIVIPEGFVFDGASVPRPFWFIMPPTGLLLIPGLIHDFAYRYDFLWLLEYENGLKNYSKYKHRSGQHYWDLLFREISMSINGMVYIDCAAWFFLKTMGRKSWRENRQLESVVLYPGSVGRQNQIKLNVEKPLTETSRQEELVS